MKTHIKKALSLIMTVLMLVTMFPLSVFAEDDILSYLTYEINDGEVTITDCDESISGDVVIPDTIEGYPVTLIGSGAFSFCDNITNVVISENVKTIGERAFKECINLTSINIPENVVEIYNEAFFGCSSLLNIEFSDNITDIGYHSLHGTAYYNDENNWKNGVLYNGKHLIDVNVNYSGNCTVKDGTLTIAASAFAALHKLENVVLPDTVKNIGSSAFYYCSLTSINIPESVESIGASAFEDSYKLTGIKVDKNNKYYASDEYGVLFNKDKTIIIRFPINNGLTTYTIPESVVCIGELTFQECDSLLSVTIPENVVNVERCAFYNCSNLKDIIIFDSVKNIGASAFRYCNNLTDVYYTGSEDDWNEINIDDYNEPLLNSTIHFNHHIHAYNNVVVTAPTCTEQGYTTYTCACGDGYVSDYVDANGHSYTSSITTPATHITTGVMTYTCTCGDTYTETIEKTTSHTYNAVVTAPTCTEQGYTTYTCACDDSYVADYISAKGHSHTGSVTTPATHLTTGVMTYTCTCGDTYTETIEKTTSHTYNAVVTAPTCTEQGYTTYTCACGDSYVADYVDANGHKDSDNDAICDSCDFVFETNEDDESGKDNQTGNNNGAGNNNQSGNNTTDEYNGPDCFCACHSNNSFISFFYKILRFIRTLLGLNYCRYCDCPYV